MAQYISDVNKTIPEIVDKGTMGFLRKYKTLNKMYEVLKAREILGPATVIEDI
jgi:hypothetical protein